MIDYSTLRMPFSQLSVGENGLLIDRFDDGAGDISFRLTLFKRLPGTFSNQYHPEGRFIPSLLYGFIQGPPGEKPVAMSFNRQGTVGVTSSTALVLPVTLDLLSHVLLPTENDVRGLSS